MLLRPATIITVALVSSFIARADDWPQWLGPQRDGVWRETGILEKFPDGGPKVLWRVPVKGGYAGPAVADGRVYLMDHIRDESVEKPKAGGFGRSNIPGTERVLCFNASNGELIWKHEYPCTYTMQAEYATGPRCTPLVKDGKVYTLGAEGDLCCLDYAKGKVLWSRDFKKDYGAKTAIWGWASHPLLDGQKLICMVGGEGSTVVAFDKDTGKEIWKALTCKNLGYAPPMIYELGGKRELIAWHGEAVNALDPETGKVYWTQPFETFMGMAIATPCKLGDDLFLTSTYKHSGLFRITDNGTKVEQLWKEEGKNSFDSVFGTPVVDGDHIYGTTSQGLLTCIKTQDGERVWQSKQPNNDKPASCADLFYTKNGDRYFIANEHGDLIIAKLTPKGYEEISRAHLLDKTSTAFGREVVWSPSAFANRCVFMRNDKELICVSLAAQ